MCEQPNNVDEAERATICCVKEIRCVKYVPPLRKVRYVHSGREATFHVGRRKEGGYEWTDH